ncbi:MAG: bifunctional aspartate kinase/homoserine dehydrogenase I [Deltaproteobacteria bacterium]|nr:bifunctional aspartate kinase/homoserine dehydrogenase I [Deltaproteobacteria bacterium]
MKVLKFGGSSVGSKIGLANILEITGKRVAQGETLIVVVSAFAKTTDQLLNAARTAAGGKDYLPLVQSIESFHHEIVEHFVNGANQDLVKQHVGQMLLDLRNMLQGLYLVGETSARTLDHVMSFGERLSAFIIAQIIKQTNAQVEYLDTRTVIRTNASHNNAVVNWEITKQNLINYFSRNKSLHIVTGFIAAGPNNETTTLGRGGSDYTASLIGAALNAETIEIWTDVDGVLTADPRKVSNTFPITQITYEEAMELSHFGAKVIYPLTMQPALEAKIPIVIKNTFNPDFPGTTISSEKTKQKATITGLSSIHSLALCRFEGGGLMGVAGIAGRLFSCLAARNISVMLISQASSEHSICFAVEPRYIAEVQTAVEEEFSLELKAHYVNSLSVETNKAIVAVVGEGMRHTPGIAGRLFQSLGKNGINIIAIVQGSSELNISFVINNEDEDKALTTIHDAFFLSELKTLNIYLVGPGAVGKKLLNQIQEYSASLERSHRLRIRLIGLTNSRKMLINAQGINLADWEDALNNSSEAADLSKFVAAIKNLRLPNCVFVDCTADAAVASCYQEVLGASISVVTPNKKANSGSWANYCAIKDTAKLANVKFFYETNVGAGLPIIGTIQSLLNSGDKIHKIEAVLSGTLSYIFNNFTTQSSFSSIVREAKEKGYTEPDPRDDLSGKDVMRKLLVLAREMNIPLEENDINVQSLVPDSCVSATSVEEFFKKLQAEDNNFATRYTPALEAGQKLRYIATIAGKDAQVSLQPVDREHPFYSLSGSDNIISFTTERYSQRPLVVKGPGAGVEVTAAGVFADIVWLSTYLI